MVTSVTQDLVERRRRWLDKKGLAPRDISDKTGLDYNTVIRWFSEPRVPQRLIREKVREFFKDFPLK